MTRTIPVSEARQTLPILVNRISTVMDRIIITRKGKPAAVLMGVEEYESRIETLEVVSQKETMGRNLYRIHRFEGWEGTIVREGLRRTTPWNV